MRLKRGFLKKVFKKETFLQSYCKKTVFMVE